MKILHTSDWHLGRAFHGVGMLDHQAAHLDHLIETVIAESVDLVVVSGDVYDRGLPPVDAVRLADEALCRLAATGVRVVVSSGNHDSGHRLGFLSGLTDAAGVHLRTDADKVAEPILLDDAHGPVAVYAIPYLNPDVARRAWSLSTRSHEAGLGEAVRRIRADLHARPAGTRSVVLAHAFVAGAEPSDSERDIAVGGVSRVPTSLFDGIDYAALGHLHGAQVLTDAVRYSGSPLAYSFSEASHAKGSWLVELDARGVHRADFVAAPVPRPVARLRGSLADLLIDPELSGHEQSWLQITLTDEHRPREPMAQLRRRFPHALSLVFERPPGTSTLRRAPLEGRGDLEIALDFVEQLRGKPASAAESALLDEAVTACCGVADAATQVSA